MPYEQRRTGHANAIHAEVPSMNVEALGEATELSREQMKAVYEKARVSLEAFNHVWRRAKDVVQATEHESTLDSQEAEGLRQVESVMARGALRKAMLLGSLLGLGQMAVGRLRGHGAGAASGVAREVYRSEQALNDMTEEFMRNTERVLDGYPVKRESGPRPPDAVNFGTDRHEAAEVVDRLIEDGTLEQFAGRPNEFRTHLSEALANRLRIPTASRLDSERLRMAFAAAEERIYEDLFVRMLSDRDPLVVARLAVLGGGKPAELAADAGNMDVAAQALHESIAIPNGTSREQTAIAELEALGMERAPQVISRLAGHDKTVVRRALYEKRTRMLEVLQQREPSHGEAGSAWASALGRARRELAALDTAIEAAGGVRVRRVAHNQGE